ncbi:MAG TPA: ATP-binding protein [Candidatus Krumholzibacteria bacterium]|nr:ATP-binding protein [Candidatus Krumholzibacteria bacterium]HRX52262.1 ATP-binding protein [Candidatus Krumholzibacteria bacterium]
MRSIRARLLGVILLAALLPAAPLSLVVRDMVARVWNPSFQDAVERGLEAGLDQARDALQSERTRLDDHVDALWNPLLTVRWPAVTVLDDAGRATAAAPPAAVTQARVAPGAAPVRVDDWLVTARRTPAGDTAAFARPLPPALVTRAEDVTGALSLLRGVRQKTESGAAQRGYVLPFLLTYGVILLVAVAVAVLFAERLARPLAALSAAARRVGDGDLDARVDARADGEIGELIGEFDRMTANLAAQRRELGRLEKLAAWRGMARILAHEIKNPLTPILLAVQEARRSDPGDHPAHSTMLADCESIVTEEVEGLRDLVRSFSDFARMPQPEPTPDDLAALLDDLARLYGDRLAVTRPDGAVPRVLDFAQLRRALINLIDNGLAATRRAGRDEPVTLELDVRGADDVLRVRDAGDGIPPENLDRVFEPDFTTGAQGMGLGLPIVRGIAEGHGGRVDLDTAPGRGTVFTLTLPRREESPA